ncbi:hypothetical protein [Xanthovirga aplysinae]|uniref:hypothetical protein n=1 Tax=Xanthovirga aplysinae TaxID=2529853 RepID=UPI0012BCD318|nr:hypothetical protein [Xanthovirga aplysinae]MTI31170.1 hypothetical protein [Xanthovirga aplysinae]
MKNVFCFLVILGFAVPLFAQEKWEEDGDIESAEVLIQKNRKNDLPMANRSFEKVAPQATEQLTPQVNFNVPNFTFNPQPIDQKIRVQTIKHGKRPVYFNNTVKAGIGNYVTPYLEAFLNAQPNKDVSVGLRAKHLSSLNGPVNKSASGRSENLLALSGKYFANKATIESQIRYERLKNYFYGYDPEIPVNIDTTRQVFHNFDFSLGLKDRLLEGPFHYNLNGNAGYFSTLTGDSESYLGYGANLSYQLQDNIEISMGSEGVFGQYSSNEFGVNRYLVKVKPRVQYQSDLLSVAAGVNLIYENSPFSREEGILWHVYPYLFAGYNLNPTLQVYGELSGGVQYNSLEGFSKENPYMNNGQIILNTYKDYGMKAGLKADLTSYFNLNTGFEYASFSNMYSFINNQTDPSRYDLTYDPFSIGVGNFFASLQYRYKQSFSANVNANYFIYDFNETPLYYKPNFKINTSLNYNPIEKLSLGVDLIVLGGLETEPLSEGEESTLNPVVDLGTKADYKLSSRSSVFLSVSNLFSQKNEYFKNYPSQGILVMLGGSYSF